MTDLAELHCNVTRAALTAKIRYQNFLVVPRQCLAGKNLRPGNLVRPPTPVRVAAVVVNVDQNTGVAGTVSAGKADETLAAVGARAGNVNSRDTS